MVVGSNHHAVPNSARPLRGGRPVRRDPRGQSASTASIFAAPGAGGRVNRKTHVPGRVHRDDARIPEHRRARWRRATGRAPLNARRRERVARRTRPPLPGGSAATRPREHHAADHLLAHIRAARTALREVVESIVAGLPAPASAVATVNALLRAHCVVELVLHDGILVARHRHLGDPLADALAGLAAPLVESVAAGETERLRICANDGCRWVFEDTSPTGRRRWCSMASCGNRAKAARHRARQRGQLPQVPITP
jgi:predicted RNA-binding Zn ribbon-like protein